MIDVKNFAKEFNTSNIMAKQMLESCGINNVTDDKVLNENELTDVILKIKDMNELFGDDTRTFIDTNILLDDNFYDFWNVMTPIIINHRSVSMNRLPIIPYMVCEELKRMTLSDDERGRKAKEVLLYIRKLKDKQLIKIMGSEQDNFPDNVFKTVFTQYRLKYNMILLTQDKGLTEDILNLNNSKADKANKVKVYKLQKNARIVDAEAVNVAPKVKVEPYVINEQPLYEIKTSPINRKDEALKVACFPKIGDTVYTEKGAMKLVSIISDTGGEGMVYKTDRGDICKIYHPAKLTINRKEKINLMISKPIRCDGVCWPTEVVYNQHKEFVGYIMPEAKGIELEKILKVKPLMQKNFPNWTKKDTIQLSITILEKMKYLHHHNIILGDINARNILVVSPTEVYFVDCDSYQLNKYPCEVGWPHFTAPELIGVDMSKQMRTMGNENFAIATLLFMIMIPGKAPYTQMGSETPLDDIAKMVFAYPKGGEKKGVVPPGQWRYCWSHLSYDLKEAFYNTFQGGEAFSKEEDRLSSADWLEKMKRYRNAIDKLIENDEQSGWLYPNNFKKHKSVVYANCKCCGNSVKEEDLTEGYCKSCLHAGDVYHCGRCGSEMIYSNLQKYVKKKPKYNECYACRKELDSVAKEIKCLACGDTFDFTVGEKEYYQSKGYEEPKRCQTCRENNVPIKQENKVIEFSPWKNKEYDNSDLSKTPGFGGGLKGIFKGFFK